MTKQIVDFSALKQIREAHGLTQKSMARLLHISHAYYGQNELGRVRRPLWLTLQIGAVLDAWHVEAFTEGMRHGYRTLAFESKEVPIEDVADEVIVYNEGVEAIRRYDNERILKRGLEPLSERSRNIIKILFGFLCPRPTLEELGKSYGLTRERIRQIKQKEMRFLRSRRAKILKHLSD